MQSGSKEKTLDCISQHSASESYSIVRNQFRSASMRHCDVSLWTWEGVLQQVDIGIRTHAGAVAEQLSVRVGTVTIRNKRRALVGSVNAQSYYTYNDIK